MNLRPDLKAFYRSLGVNIHFARDAAWLTQKELGERVGFSRVMIANIEAGRQRLPTHQLVRFASALHCRPADLLPRNAK